MFSLPILAALAVIAVITSFISGIFCMAGGMLLIGAVYIGQGVWLMVTR